MTRIAGETVLLQEVWNGRVWAARPMTLVEDDGNSVALWFPKGTVWKAPTTPPSRPRAASRGERLAECAALGDWVFADSAWDVSTLILVRADAWHAVWISWLDDGRQWGWYVNLQEPYRRTPCGYATMDLMLDVVAELDGRWRWKDEDELDAFVARGVFDAELARRLRVEGLGVVRRLERREPPFDEDGRARWRPDASWEPPRPPAGWDVPCR